jgi:hypothetical protein
MGKKGWWKQIQSGEYPETQKKYGDSKWIELTINKCAPIKEDTKGTDTEQRKHEKDSKSISNKREISANAHSIKQNTRAKREDINFKTTEKECDNCGKIYSHHIEKCIYCGWIDTKPNKHKKDKKSVSINKDISPNAGLVKQNVQAKPSPILRQCQNCGKLFLILIKKCIYCGWSDIKTR